MDQNKENFFDKLSFHMWKETENRERKAIFVNQKSVCLSIHSSNDFPIDWRFSFGTEKPLEVKTVWRKGMKYLSIVFHLFDHTLPAIRLLIMGCTQRADSQCDLGIVTIALDETIEDKLHVYHLFNHSSVVQNWL